MNLAIKILKMLVIALVALTCVTRAASELVPVPPLDLVVILSGHAPTATLEGTRKLLYSLLLRDAPQGARVSAWDGAALTRIFETDVPLLRYDNPEVRAVKLAPVIAAIKKWVEQTSHAPREEKLSGTWSIRLPEVLAELSPSNPATLRRILVMASPFYLSVSEPGFSMQDSRYPSDAHLDASVAETVFGTAGRPQALARTTLYWAYGHESQWSSGAHKLAVQRWWSLWAAAMAGKLGYFGNDSQIAVSRLLTGEQSSAAMFVRNPDDTKIEMHSARPRVLPSWLEIPVVPPPSPASSPAPALIQVPVESAHTSSSAAVPEPPPVPAPVVEQPQIAVVPAPAVVGKIAPPLSAPFLSSFDVTKTGIGIAWSAPKVDLDLYVRLFPRAQELFYRRDRSAEGFLFKDERSPNAGRDFEFVEFHGSAVDLSQACIWVNYYSGRIQNITGQVVLFDRGRVKVGTFSLPASKGNRGGDAGKRSTSPYWAEIRLNDLVETTAPLAARKPGAQ